MHPGTISLDPEDEIMDTESPQTPTQTSGPVLVSLPTSPTELLLPSPIVFGNAALNGAYKSIFNGDTKGMKTLVPMVAKRLNPFISKTPTL